MYQREVEELATKLTDLAGSIQKTISRLCIGSIIGLAGGCLLVLAFHFKERRSRF